MIDTNKLQDLAKNFSILYVEDEEKLRESVVQYLSKFFKSVDVGIDGEDGLEKYTQGKFDLVITDIAMPKLSGIGMAQSIKELNPNQEIVIISAFSESDKLLDAIKIGVDSYMIKPINFKQMNEVLYKIIYKLKEFRENDLYKIHLKELAEIKSEESEKLQIEKVQNYKNTLYALVDLVEQRDTYTGGHSTRVARYSQLIAYQMGLGKSICQDIYEAGMLHDIGKIVIPDSILLNPGNLNDVEYKLIQEHAMIGYKILKKVPMFKNIAEIIKLHHERLDGSGYPEGLKGDKIPIASMIMAVADTFDAITTKRIYKSKKTVDSALNEISLLSGKLFLKEVVDAAIVVLKDVNLNEDIDQLPRTTLEKERFSYFYKDQLTKVYNSKYLDLILAQNKYEKKYKQIYILFLHDFGKYNNKYGWEKGDKLLQDIACKMKDIYTDTLIFRIHGDDFVLISNNDIDLNYIKEYFSNEEFSFKNSKVNIKENNIVSFNSFGKYLNYI